MTSRAREFYQRLVESPSPVKAIEALVDDRQPENDYLEFKTGEIGAKEAKHYWSKVLSGFANTEGGVLIWGVDARPTASADDPSVKVDAACGIIHVKNPLEFAERLRRVLLEATVHPVAGVEVREFSSESGGFVVCFIPEGRHKPYRAALDDSKNYYHRVGDSFAVISHGFVVSDRHEANERVQSQGLVFVNKI